MTPYDYLHANISWHSETHTHTHTHTKKTNNVTDTCVLVVFVHSSGFVYCNGPSEIRLT